MNMAISVNTNIASLQAQNNLSQVNRALEQNQERLSSGLRINSAADDPAGLAISDRMTAQVRGMNQATRNAQNGISMAQTAEGGMQEITNMLQRMRELAVQSANETNTKSDRQSLDKEFQNLAGELDRIAQSTQFNGKSLLDGSLGDATFQVGANTGSENQITFDMSNSMRADDLGRRYEGTIGFTTGTAAGSGQTLTANEVTVNNETLDLSGYESESGGTNILASGRVRESAWAIADAINNNADLQVEAEANNTAYGASEVSGATTYTMSVNSVNIMSAASGTISATLAADKINAQDNLNVEATVTDSGALELSDPEGGDIHVAETGTSASGFFGTSTTYAQGGTVNLQATQTINFADVSGGTEFGNVTATGTGVGGYSVTGAAASFSTVYTNQNDSLAQMDVASVTNAQDAIDKIDAAINDVDTTRATMGAAQNRLESTIANLENSVQNLTESRARIKDADIAKQAAEQTQNNVRRQAAASVLTQANQNPQLALQLLGG
jgi:flagellin